jgi:hypothetical protein
MQWIWEQQLHVRIENLNSKDGRTGVGIPERSMRTGMIFGAFDIENNHSEIQQAHESTSFSV